MPIAINATVDKHVFHAPIDETINEQVYELIDVLGDAQGQSVDAHTTNRDVLSPIVIDVQLIMPTMTSITSGMNTTYDQYDVQNIIILYFCILTTFLTMNYNVSSTFLFK